MPVALVHDWLTGMRGGERVLDVLCGLYPDADIFTLLYVRGSVSETIERHRIHTNALLRLPLLQRRYRQLLPLFPSLVEHFDFDPYDLVISTSHCAAKSVIRTGRARHISYCHSPMRYAWDQFESYFGPARVGAWTSRRIYRPVLARLARWDAATAMRVDRFLANSHHVAARIRRYYNRVATVVHPPVDTHFFHADATIPGEHLLIVSALVPYKRIDLAIDACRRVGAKLRIVGDGPDRARLERIAGVDVEFTGWLDEAQVRDEYRRATATLLPGEEDFGIAPVESQACARPVVALGRGGAVETIIDGETGVLVQDASVESFAAGLERLARLRFEPDRLRANAERFSRERHVEQMQTVICETVSTPIGQRW
jgi:glycosyltransferase involved in cell wall biosynthesis